MQAWQRAGRSRPPEETVLSMRPYFGDLGITRVAKWTGLDDIGLPVYASFRPTSQTIAANQGKGLGDWDAQASAVMEAVEFAIAEAPRAETKYASLAELQRDQIPIFWPTQLLPAGFELAADRPINWVPAKGLVTQRPCFVPRDAVVLSASARDLPGICQSTNGLASGNTRDEAIFHALCELIERDASTRWLLLSQEQRHRTRFNHATLLDPDLNAAVAKVAAAGKQVDFFDQTTDIGAPVVMAVIAGGPASRRFDLAAGYGAHITAASAAIRAVTEAAQTRITSIAAARDDIAPNEFQAPIDTEGLELAGKIDIPRRSAPMSLALHGTAHANIAVLARALQTARLTEPVVVDLDGGKMPCSVVRLLSADLEDMEANLNWRPGIRAQGWISA